MRKKECAKEGREFAQRRNVEEKKGPEPFKDFKDLKRESAELVE